MDFNPSAGIPACRFRGSSQVPVHGVCVFARVPIKTLANILHVPMYDINETISNKILLLSLSFSVTGKFKRPDFTNPIHSRYATSALPRVYVSYAYCT